MNILNTLRISIVALIVTIAVFSCILIFSTGQINQAFHRVNLSREIMRAATDLNNLTQDHVFHSNEERIHLQWQARYKSLESMLITGEELFFSLSERQILQEIRINLHNVHGMYGQFQTKDIKAAFMSRTDWEKIEVLLLDHILMKLRFISTLSTDLNRLSEMRINRAILISVISTGFFITLAVTFVVLGLIWFNRRIIEPLHQIQRGTETVSQGELDVEVPVMYRDEIGFLATTFNRMTRHLKESLAQLRYETENRIKAQEEITEIQDKEQKRIGRELHDGLSQELTSLSFMLKILQNKLINRTQIDPQELQKARDALQGTIEESRSMARRFYPLELERMGLRAALQDLALSISTSFKIKCQFVGENMAEFSDKFVEGHLYRITQEAIQNSVRHGNAANILIRLYQQESWLILRIEDDGTGFDPDHHPQGMGLRTMRYRATLIKASIEFNQREPRGTVVMIRCPMPSPQRNQDLPELKTRV